MDKRIDLKRSVFELTQTYPELVDIMANLGFSEIKKPAVLHSVGKLMTIPKGAGVKNIPLERVVTSLREHGFEVVGLPSQENETTAEPQGGPAPASDSRTELIKGYLRRLSGGEDLESVRADFVRNFSEVEASEIMQAEQELLAEGVPLEDVQQLCDVHSALFHGATREERIANAEKEVAASLKRTAPASSTDYSDKAERAASLAAIPGHPLHTFTRENEALSERIHTLREKLTHQEDVTEALAAFRELSVHYAKKGDLLYPHLKVKYEISGPSEVMWTVDDEIRAELGELAEATQRDSAWNERLEAVIQRADEMIYKENNILFPICAVNFTEQEWIQIYRDAKAYGDCLGVQAEVWTAAEQDVPASAATPIGEIVMSGGHLTPAQLTALLNTIPMEITFVDEDNINRFFNEGPKVFKRPAMALDREVFSCHPPKIEPMVRSIINDFRSGKQDKVPIWMEKNGRTVLVTYMAVRDRDGAYVGTMELVQDLEFAKEHFSE